MPCSVAGRASPGKAAVDTAADKGSAERESAEMEVAAAHILADSLVADRELAGKGSADIVPAAAAAVPPGQDSQQPLALHSCGRKQTCLV